MDLAQVVGEECSLEVYIANPCSIQVKVDRLSLSAQALNGPEDTGSKAKLVQPIPVAVVLPGKTKPTRWVPSYLLFSCCSLSDSYAMMFLVTTTSVIAGLEET